MTARISLILGKARGHRPRLQFAQETPCCYSNIGHRTEIIERARLQAARHDRASAGVPSQKRLIIARRPDFFSLLVQVHCFAEKIERRKVRSWSRPPHVYTRLTFEENSLVVCLQILVSKSRQQRPSLVEIVENVLAEQIRQRKDQQYKGLTIVRLYCKNILANALGLRRLIEQSI